MTLDAASRAYVETLASLPKTHQLTPPQAREAGRRRIEIIGPGPTVASSTDYVLATTDNGSFTVRLLIPEGDIAGMVVYFHGGGWVLGNIDQFDTLGRRLAVDASAAVALVNYRKAPEHRFPAAIKDAEGALRWADGLRQQWGATTPLVTAGDSSGANVAISAGLTLSRTTGVQISGQVLVYPVTDSRTDTPSYLDPSCQLLVSRETMRWFWSHYATPKQQADPRAAPLRSGGLRVSPPTWLAVARYDPLYSEGVAYGQALQAADVALHLTVFEEQMHGFLNMINILPAADIGRAWLASSVNAAFSSAKPS